MIGARARRRSATLLTAAAVLAVLSPQAGGLSAMPDALVMNAGGVASLEVALPLRAEVADDSAVIARVDQSENSKVSLTAGDESGTAEVVFRLLGLVPVKTMTVTVEQPRRLIPGGRSLGVALETEGVVVVGSSDLGKIDSPARRAGILPGDVIQTVNGERVEGSEALSGMIADGEAVTLGVLRSGERMNIDVQPKEDPRDGAYRLGVWVRQSTAGVGTLTYYDPESGQFGALGHAITDVDTGVTFPVGEGAVYENEVVRVTRGAENAPGELTGEFFDEEIVLGEIEKNTGFGVFGVAEGEMGEDCLYPEGLLIGRRDEIHTGKAQILSCIGGETVKAYDCEIEKLYAQGVPETRSMVIRITDEELLNATGGIVQGMSGSPVIQDGKIVGAVTHVFISDPTRGYGVYIEWMLDAAA